MAESTYTTRDRVIERLTTLHNPAVLTNSIIDRIIAERSDEVDSAMSATYTRFNNITDTPATPRQIERLCLAGCTLGCWELLKPLLRGTKLVDEIDSLEEWWEKTAQSYVSGKDIVRAETVTSETLVWGDGSQWGIETNEAHIAGTGTTSRGEVITILEPTVRVVTPATLTGYRVGRGFDFYLRFDTTLRWWILVDKSQQLQAQASTITYQWCNVRYAEPPSAGDQASGTFQLV